MSKLSPQLKDLVLAGKRSVQHSDSDVVRISSALRDRLGDSVVLGTEGSHAVGGNSSGFSLGKLAAVGLAGVAFVGGLLVYATRTRQVDAVETIVSPVTSVTLVVADSDTLPASTNAPPAVQPVPMATREAAKIDHAEAKPVSSHPARDNLPEEVAILSRAETALHNGKPEVALRLLAEHERKFGNGILAEERIAARLQALCALGRTAEAEAQLAHLSPKSLHGQGARKACGNR